MKKRYQQRKANLELATKEELFTELMNRVLSIEPRVCYFIDRTTANGWNIHSANMLPIIEMEVK